MPIADWFRGPLRERLRSALNSEVLRSSDVFEPRRLQRIFEQHDKRQRDWSSPLWSILMFEAFLRAEAR